MWRDKGRKVLFSCYEFDITVREAMFSFVILFLMLTLGFFISEKISSKQDEANQDYYQAVKIEGDTEVFRYGMRTDIGNAFVSGKLEAVDPVSYPDIPGQYAYIERVKERYTQHTRVVTHTRTVNGKTQTYTTTETYYTWDRVGSEDWHCGSIRFLNTDFEYGKIDFPDSYHLETIKESSNVRYKYYVRDTEYSGTIYADLRNGTVNKAIFINGVDTAGAVEYLVRSGVVGIIIFWIVWVVLTGAAIYGFVYLDNKWLED